MSEATSKFFRLAKLRFALTPLDPIGLPPFKGSSLRGGFGRIFRRIGCAASALGARECPLPDRCPYHYVFETPPPADSRVLERLPAAPHPFVIEPPPETKRRYAPGETIEFHLTLIGRAIDYLPYFIVAFEELGRHGIGPGNGRYALSGIDGINADGRLTPLYSGEGHRLMSQWPALHPDDLTLYPEPAPAEATLVFLTPTLVRHANQPGDLTKFHVLFRNLLRRVSLLDYFHCGGEWGPGPQALLKLAEAIETPARTLQWRRWERYSARQRQPVPMGGWVGRVTYRGDLAPFWLWLLLGEWVHVGKHATFGLGQYRIEKAIAAATAEGPYEASARESARNGDQEHIPDTGVRGQERR